MKLFIILLTCIIFILPECKAQASISNDSMTYQELLAVKKKQVWDSVTQYQTKYINSLPKVIQNKEITRKYINEFGMFYVLCGILLWLGLMNYFGCNSIKRILGVFTNTTNSIRFVKESLGQNALHNFMMNLFFCVVGGIYLYYFIVSFGKDDLLNQYPKSVLIGLNILVLVVIYVLRYSFLKMMGNIFEMKEVASEYIFNVFLVNKVLAIILLPFVIIMAFGTPLMVRFASIISILIIALSFLNRYARSQGAISQIVKLNKFHFFLYLCASEILPIAVLGKFIADNMN